MKKIGLVFMICAIYCVLCAFIYAQEEESLTIITYYPAPYGVYTNLKVADQMWVGRDASGNLLTGGSPLLQVGGTADTAYSIYGFSNSSYGVYGRSASSIGVHGRSDSFVGVYGFSPVDYGVYGHSYSSYGVFGLSNSSYGVYARSTTGIGVYAESDSNTGVYGIGGTYSVGVLGYSFKHYGVHGKSTSSYGVFGEHTASDYLGAGVYGYGAYSTGVYGSSSKSKGVYGQSTSSYGVHAESTSSYGLYAKSYSSYGIYAEAPKSYGVYGKSTSSYGVYGKSTSSYGVYGKTDAAYNAGVYGECTNSYGPGVYGYNAYDTGVKGWGSDYDFYAAGPGTNYGSFTGAHDVKLNPSIKEIEAGMLVITTDECKIRDDSISSVLATVDLASSPMDNRIFGVFVAEQKLQQEYWYKSKEGERFGIVNSLGEGLVWVTDINGPLENGDYITTSNIPGYGQRQDDNILHSYTLGKVIQGVDWDKITDTIEYNGKKYKKCLIAVTYKSG